MNRQKKAAITRWGDRPPEEIRTVKVLIKISPNEKQNLDERAAASGLSKTEYIVKNLDL